MKLLNTLHREGKKISKKYTKAKEISDRLQKKVEAMTLKSANLVESSISITRKHVNFLEQTIIAKSNDEDERKLSELQNKTAKKETDEIAICKFVHENDYQWNHLAACTDAKYDFEE